MKWLKKGGELSTDLQAPSSLLNEEPRLCVLNLRHFQYVRIALNLKAIFVVASLLLVNRD